MNDSLEIQLKNEIDDIVDRIDTIMRKIDELVPEKKEEEPQEEPPPQDRAQIIEKKRRHFRRPAIDGRLS